MHKIYLLTLLSTIVTAQGMESNNPEPESARTKVGNISRLTEIPTLNRLDRNMNPNIMGVIMNYRPLDEAKDALSLNKRYEKSDIIKGRLLDTDINLTQFVDNLLYMKKYSKSLKMFINNLKERGPKTYTFHKKYDNEIDRDEDLWGNLGKVHSTMNRKQAAARLDHNEKIMKIKDPNYHVENREAEIQKIMKEGHFIEMAPFRIPKELSYIIIQVTDDPDWDAISAENPFEERTTYILGPNTMLKKYKEIVNSFKDKGFNMESKSILSKTGKVGYWVNSRAVKAEFEGSTRDKKTYVYVDFYGHNINEDGTPLNPNLDEYGQPKVQQQDVNKTEESKDNQ